MRAAMNDRNCVFFLPNQPEHPTKINYIQNSYRKFSLSFTFGREINARDETQALYLLGKSSSL